MVLLKLLMTQVFFRVYLPDGSCNNLRNPSQGQTGRAHKRLLDPAYGNARGNFVVFPSLIQLQQIKLIL